MIWLAGQVWPFLAVAALLGAVLVLVFCTRRVTVDRWVEEPQDRKQRAGRELDTADVPAEPGPAAAGAVASGATTAGSGRSGSASPFPFPGAAHPAEPAPWEQEEMWSRPARRPATRVPAGERDEWSEAADSWRTWADDMVGKRAEPESERDAARWEPAGPVDTAFRYDEPVDTPLAHQPDPFPYAEPVDTPAPLPRTDPFPAVDTRPSFADARRVEPGRPAEPVGLAEPVRPAERTRPAEPSPFPQTDPFPAFPSPVAEGRGKPEVRPAEVTGTPRSEVRPAEVTPPETPPSEVPRESRPTEGDAVGRASGGGRHRGAPASEAAERPERPTTGAPGGRRRR